MIIRHNSNELGPCPYQFSKEERNLSSCASNMAMYRACAAMVFPSSAFCCSSKCCFSVKTLQIRRPIRCSTNCGRLSFSSAILIALNASVDQVVIVVIPAGCPRPIMINGEFAAHGSLGHATIAAPTLIALADRLELRRCPEPVEGGTHMTRRRARTPSTTDRLLPKR